MSTKSLTLVIIKFAAKNGSQKNDSKHECLFFTNVILLSSGCSFLLTRCDVAMVPRSFRFTSASDEIPG